MNCINGFSWCGNTSGRGYCSDQCRGDRKLADETRRIDVALKEYDRRTSVCGKPVAFGLRCNRQPGHPTGCRWESVSAAAPPPRPVKQVSFGRGGLLDDMAVMLAGAAALMSDETATCGQAEEWCRVAAELLAQYDRRRDECQPRPVERCSCPEALRYKAALEEIRNIVEGRAEMFGSNARHAEIERIARRALALGGETER